MIGEIEKYSSDDPLVGVIKSSDISYDFNVKVWRSTSAPKVGDAVQFDLNKKGQVSRVKPYIIYPEHLKPVKSRWIAGVLGLLLGMVGAHRIYLGFYGIAALQTAVFLIMANAGLAGFGILWGFLEGALILASHIDKDAKGRTLK